jgi:hypothetical protein
MYGVNNLHSMMHREPFKRFTNLFNSDPKALPPMARY